MAINKNFVVKNGLEVDTSLIVADADNNRVGIGTTIPSHLLHVLGGIGATTLDIAGVTTTKTLIVSAGATFHTQEAPVLIGVAASTNTPLQDLQVGSATTEKGAYISGNTGIGVTLPGARLNVVPSSTGIAGLFSGTTSGDMVRITQLGTGNALVVEDSSNPDVTSFIISGLGSVGIGTSFPRFLLDVDTTTSTGTTALFVRGDVRITGDLHADDLTFDELNITGISTFANTTENTLGNADTGAVQIDGGLGVNKNVTVGAGLSVVGGFIVQGFSTFTSPVDVNNNVDISGITTFSNTTENTLGNVNTGSVQLDGGLGVAKNTTIGAGLSVIGGLRVAGLSTFVGISTFVSDLFVGGSLGITSNFIVNSNLNILGIATIGTLHVTGLGTIDGNLRVGGITTFTNTTENTLGNADTGAVQFDGGVGINKNLTVGAGLSVVGGLNVQGLSTFTSSVDINNNVDISGITTFSNTTENTLGDVNTGSVQLDGGLGVAKNATIGAGLSVVGGLIVQGISTFTSLVDANGGATIDNVRIGIADDNTIDTSTGSLTIDSAGGTVTINDNARVTGVATFLSSVDVGTALTAGTVLVGSAVTINPTGVNVAGVTTTGSLVVNGEFDVFDTDATFHGNVTIDGNLSIGGTSTIINAQSLRIEDKDIVLGFTTTQEPTDTTANHGGIAIASTEGTPLVPMRATGINTLPDTYKQIMWVAKNTFGVGTTDAFLFNYGVGIGSTQVPTGVRLAVSSVQITDNSVNAANFVGTNVNASGITSTNSLNIGATQVISSGRQLQNIASLDATTTATIEAAIASGPNTFTDLKVTGITTLGITSATDFVADNVRVSLATTTTRLAVTGIATAETLQVGNLGLNVSGVGTVLSSFNVGAAFTAGTALVGSAVTINPTGVNVTGVVTATQFVGDGSQLTNTGAALTTPSGVLRLLATSLTTGIVTSAAADADLTFDAGTNILNVTGGLNVSSGVATLSSAVVGSNIVLNSTGVNVTGVVTASSGFNIGISSAGTVITTGVITAINFTGTGNTITYNSGTKTVDVFISGGGGESTWRTYTAGIATAKSVGINTSNLDDPDLTGIGNSFQGLYIGNGMVIVDNQLNGDHYIGTNFNGLMAGPVTINGTLTVDGNYVVV